MAPRARPPDRGHTVTAVNTVTEGLRSRSRAAPTIGTVVTVLPLLLLDAALLLPASGTLRGRLARPAQPTPRPAAHGVVASPLVERPLVAPSGHARGRGDRWLDARGGRGVPAGPHRDRPP